MDQLRKDLAAINKRMALLSVKPKRKKRSRKGGNRVPGTTTVPIGTSAVNRRRGRSSVCPSAEGEIVLRRREFVVSFVAKANKTETTYTVEVTPDAFPFLKNLWQSFERNRWQKLNFMWKPAVGTTFGGLVAYGFDSAFNKALTKAKVMALTPSVDHAVWQDSTARPLVVPRSVLQTRAWYLDTGDKENQSPGYLAVAAAHQSNPTDVVLGELWVDYEIRMSGTRSSA